MRFSSFLDKKTREIKRQLEIIKDALTEQKVEVKGFLKGENPYLFIEDPEHKMDFGVRVYKIGSDIAYRVQREKDTQPYGEAYPIDIEEYFSDLISDMSEDDAADKIKKALAEEIKSFFKKSSEASDELMSSGSDEGTGRIIISTGMNDMPNVMP